MNRLPAPPSSTFADLKEKGNKAAGIVVDINGNGKAFSGEPCPAVVLNSRGTLLTVTCSQAQLWSKTVAAVEAGTLKVGVYAEFECVGVEQRTGGKTLKLYEIRCSDPTAEQTAEIDDVDRPF